MRRLVLLLTAFCLLAASTAGAASAINGGNAQADGNDFAGDICSSPGLICMLNQPAGAYYTGVNRAGSIEWNVYNVICYVGITGEYPGHETVLTGWGPFSTSVESTPLKVVAYNRGYGC